MFEETPDRGYRIVLDRRRVHFPVRSPLLMPSSRASVSAGGMSKHLVIFATLLFCQLAAAQFGFFEQMFQGEHPGRQQRQRPPGADHWRTQADASESFPARTGYIAHTLLATSPLFDVPLPRYPCLCGRTRAVPLPERGRHQMRNPRRSR